MKPRIISLLSLFLSTLLAGPALAEAAWHTVDGEQYKASMPVTPTVTRQTISTPAGEVVERRFLARTQTGVFTLSDSVLPGAALLLGGGAEATLDRATEALIQEGRLTDTSRKNTTYAGHSARRLSYTGAGGRGDALLVLVGRRLLVLDAQARAADTQRFLASLKLR